MSAASYTRAVGAAPRRGSTAKRACEVSRGSKKKGASARANSAAGAVRREKSECDDVAQNHNRKRADIIICQTIVWRRHAITPFFIAVFAATAMRARTRKISRHRGRPHQNIQKEQRTRRHRHARDPDRPAASFFCASAAERGGAKRRYACAEQHSPQTTRFPRYGAILPKTIGIFQAYA